MYTDTILHKIILLVILPVLFLSALNSCNYKNTDGPAKTHYPTEQYEFVTIDTSAMISKNNVYVPIYSNMYMVNGTRPTLFAATLSIRSTDFTDSIYITEVDYFNSRGKIIKKYLDRTLLIKPMHSAEFIVEEKDTEGGAGAYFIVNWQAAKPVNEPLIQSVMLSTVNSLGFSIKTDGIKLNKK